MPESVHRERLEILGEHVVAAAHEGQRSRCLDEADRAARARAEGDVARQLGQAVACGLARGDRDLDRVADQGRVDVDVEDGPLQRLQVLQREHLPELGRRDELPLHDRQLLVVLGVADRHLEHEAVDLRLGQRVGPFRLDRVLRRHDEERVRYR